MNKTALLPATSMLLAALAAPQLASAQQPAPAPEFEAEKCFGIAKAGKNDCASTGNNSCAGTSRLDGDPRAWVYMPAGYCDRLVDGSPTPKA